VTTPMPGSPSWKTSSRFSSLKAVTRRRGDARGWSELFTDDGIFEVVAEDNDAGAVFQGKAALEDLCKRFTDRVYGLHFMHIPQFELGVEGTAQGRMHFEFRSAARNSSERTRQEVIIGIYEVTYRLTGIGWRMSHRIEKVVGRDKSLFYFT
jgi:hypothetical protein